MERKRNVHANTVLTANYIWKFTAPSPIRATEDGWAKTGVRPPEKLRGKKKAKRERGLGLYKNEREGEE